MNKIFIEKLVPGGQGIGVDENGKKGFFWNALPGETVTKYTITKNKSHYFEAITEEIENPSTHRVAPKDACFLATSPWQIMDYDYELTQKAELLEEQFNQFGIELPKSLIQTDYNDYFYRNKMEYSLYWDNSTEKISLAFHQRGSHRKIPIENSSIERPEIFAKAKEIVAGLNAQHEEARKYQSLLLRANQNGEVSGGLYENKKPHPTFKNLTDTILGNAYSYSPNGFFQINLPVYEMALTEIKKHIRTDKVLDLYSGVGTIGLSVARDKDLTLVECNKFAYAELERNSTGRPIAIEPTCVLANSEDALEFVAPDQTVIVDPPRAGCDAKLLNKFIEVQPETIIYLSCNPATQARDVKILLDSNRYQISSVTPFNFFPRTPHLENLIVLQKIRPCVL
ncbi:class I SAM-dependent RNA methyltransferase [Candidatus Saccharibacteria bacterium]|nr:class I SAM-dependent RNA methyltransferase [Candidatus Saccharibacteria bacterium]